MNEKAQGALEYLLLIGGAVLIAAIVLTLLTGIGQEGADTTGSRAGAAQCEPLDQSRCEDPAWSNGNCVWSEELGKCTVTGNEDLGEAIS
jgi:hypothetical protein